MSTAHNGCYCSVKDKMMLDRNEASREAGRLGMSHYRCEHCGTWHLANRRNKKRMRMKHG